MSALVSFRQTTAMDTNNGNNIDNHTPPRTFGITQPISLKGPEESDWIATQNLEETLRSYDYFESEVELTHRVDVMTKLNALVRKWIREKSLEKNVPLDVVDTVGGHVHTFGSYRLGVHSKGGDIDTLLIAPRHIDRSDFFISFVEYLRRQPEVCDLRSIEEAFVPVIKLTFDGIELDMLFARLALPTIPDSLDLKDDKILLNLDPRCVRSLNGCRVTDEILDLVPNRETFKSTLRAIKLWAKECGLYSNALGFFGGVTWAMLVARICQLYPNAIAATLVHKFFTVYSKWEWPTPVLLKAPHDSRFGFTVWDPVANPYDRHHLMPVITPAYPQQNSTHNVSQSTKKLIVQEIKRGLNIVNDIMVLKRPWKDLFTGIPFLQRYKHFIILLLSAPEQNQFLEWSGLVEAKIRFLVSQLERNVYIEIAHVSADKYTPDDSVFQNRQQTANSTTNGETSTLQTNGYTSPNTPTPNSTQQSAGSPSAATPTSVKFNGMWAVGLQFGTANNVQLDLTEEIRRFITGLHNAASNKVGMSHENIYLDARYIRRRDLHKILSRRAATVTNQTAESSRTDNTDVRSEPETNPNTKRLIDSVSSSTVNGSNESPEPECKRSKLEQTQEIKDESAQKTSESNSQT